MPPLSLGEASAEPGGAAVAESWSGVEARDGGWPKGARDVLAVGAALGEAEGEDAQVGEDGRLAMAARISGDGMARCEAVPEGEGLCGNVCGGILSM